MDLCLGNYRDYISIHKKPCLLKVLGKFSTEGVKEKVYPPLKECSQIRWKSSLKWST